MINGKIQAKIDSLPDSASADTLRATFTVAELRTLARNCEALPAPMLAKARKASLAATLSAYIADCGGRYLTTVEHAKRLYKLLRD